MDLPPGDFFPYNIIDDIDFSYPEDPYRLHADADSSHATDLESCDQLVDMHYSCFQLLYFLLKL